MNPAELANKLLIELPPYYELVALLRAYGDARAEEMRDRCVMAVQQQGDRSVDAEAWADIAIIIQDIRALPTAPTPPGA